MDYVMVIDVNKCIGCETCVVACKDEHFDNEYPPYTAPQPEVGQFWIRVQMVERGTFPKVKLARVPIPCMHCDNPPCVAAATGGAIYKRSDGIVIIDPAKSVGQRQLVDACPYGVIYYNQDADIPQKCAFCVHRLESGKTPRCVDACIATQALIFGDRADLKATIEEKGAVPLHPEYGAKPRVYYVGLPKTFIAGALVDSKGECLAGADVTATDTASGTVVAKATSDTFGDFWLDGLDVNKTYDVAITSAGKTKTISVSLDTDKNLGDIQL
jgi:Fe-S-cluster-containing dehydrogenase component